MRLAYRKSSVQGLSEAEERMCQGLDSAAVLLKDGEIVAAAEEERFNLDKHTCAFPLNAINFCLNEAKASITDVDFICHGFNFSEWQSLYEIDEFSKNCYDQILSPSSQIKLFEEKYNLKQAKDKFIPVRHHTAHAASAFYPSNFEKALVIVADGIGEIDSISIYQGEGKNLQALQHYNIFSSLGIFYSLITHHLGFDVNSDEYKTMGLAPYGDSERYKSFFNMCIELQENGEIFIPVFSKNKTLLEKHTYRALREWIAQQTFPARAMGTEVLQEHKDLAAGLQSALNTAMLHLCSYWKQKTGLSKLCLAGGVALNCVSNSVLLKSELFDEIYVPPAAGDPGTALGAALYKHYNLGGKSSSANNKELPFYGPCFTDNEILEVLDRV
jgi:carbamoyltransferase